MRTHPKMAMVELGQNGLPCRIFRSAKLAAQSKEPTYWMLRATAVRLIREQAYERSGGVCEHCKRNLVTWDSGELHEVQPKGMTNFVLGEVSLENSEFWCRFCHRGAHANRRPQWSKPGR